MRTCHSIKDKDIKNKTGICVICGPVKIGHSGGGVWRCRNSLNRKERIGKMRRKYGLDVNGKDFVRPINCELCNGTTRIAYDHDHATGKHRGWLCMKCNTALGLVNDDPALLQKMINYLKK